jgi:hypothetical protein
MTRWFIPVALDVPRLAQTPIATLVLIVPTRKKVLATTRRPVQATFLAQLAIAAFAVRVGFRFRRLAVRSAVHAA